MDNFFSSLPRLNVAKNDQEDSFKIEQSTASARVSKKKTGHEEQKSCGVTDYLRASVLPFLKEYDLA